jgi:exodeoxyribonuclease-3
MRKEFDSLLYSHIKKLQKNKHIILAGDFNVAHQDIDVYNPEAKKNKKAGFMDFERHNFQKYLDIGFVDAFRLKYPQKQEFTFRDYRQKKGGWRVDYFLL